MKSSKAQDIWIFRISHDIRNVCDLADRSSVMKNDRLVGTARVCELVKDEALGMIIMEKCQFKASPVPGASMGVSIIGCLGPIMF